MKTINEQAFFDKETGVTFTYDTLETGAVFTLETKDGLGIFKNVPVGTFYLREIAPSSDEFVLSKEVIRIESTKDGIKAHDKENKLIGESPAPSEKTEATITFELANYLKKCTAELTKKDVSTGELLPDTGVRILNNKKEIFTEGRTDDRWVFSFDLLPTGTYYFQEYDAPEGYVLDKTPMEFEIKDDGEM